MNTSPCDRNTSIFFLRGGELIEKGHVKAHFRRDAKSGKMVFIKDHDVARDAPADHSIGKGDKMRVNNPKSKHHGKFVEVKSYSDKYDSVYVIHDGGQAGDFRPHHLEHVESGGAAKAEPKPASNPQDRNSPAHEVKAEPKPASGMPAHEVKKPEVKTATNPSNVILLNLALTDKKGGPVMVVTNSRGGLSVSIPDGDRRYGIQATQVKAGWKVVSTSGITPSRKIIDDAEMARHVAGVFAKVKGVGASVAPSEDKKDSGTGFKVGDVITMASGVKKNVLKVRDGALGQEVLLRSPIGNKWYRGSHLVAAGTSSKS